MAATLNHIMQDDSLAASLFAGHDYKRSLVGDSLAEPDSFMQVDVPMKENNISFFDGLAHFFESVPWIVYAVIGVLLLALLVWWLIRSGLLGDGFSRPGRVESAEGDDIYDIDYEEETKKALLAGDYAALVRLIYLRTLRTLDEEGRISWRIYKTPTEYAYELRQPAFITMTRHFLRVRYGKFGASEALCDEMRALQAEVEKGGEV
ncbi:MAG: DUF4129 domain-containing protein [Prevotella sp.]|nr:DUF4129 domain-containing protein [Prevotella sp.]